MTVRPSATGATWSDTLGRAGTRAAQILLILALAGVTIYGLLAVSLVVIPILLALILTAAIAPLVTWLKARGLPSAAATGVSFLGLLAVFGGTIFGIVIAVRREMPDLIAHATEGFDQTLGFVKNGPFQLDAQAMENARDTAVGYLTSSSFSSGALTGLGAVTSFITGFVLLAVVLFYFLKDGEHIWRFMLRGFGGDHRAKAELAGRRSMEVLGGYVRGTAAVAAVDAVCIGAALAILQVPLALPLAVLTFVGGFIPLVGATAAGILAVLVALVSNGPVGAIIVLAVVVIVNQLEGNFLQPVLMGKAMAVHGLVILLALTVGTILAGIIGAVLSVPLTAVGWAVIKVWSGQDTSVLLPDPQETQQPETVPA
ncbi:AI-2E family transporter [Arthrobacter sp. UYCo732]|uniref:AI-2E family transporter n=1 Tax=Arthrobacter sp. UYCo732 TaxID=3156336 RepID=UPI003390BD72